MNYGRHAYQCEHCERDGAVGVPPNAGCDSVVAGQLSVSQILDRIREERGE